MGEALVPISILLILALAVCAVAMALSPGFSQSVKDMASAFAEVSAHALERHGEDAIAASQCADRPEIRMVNPKNNRIAFICMTERGWGIYIAEADGRNVTAMVKEKMKKLADVLRYMRNAGYELLQ